MMEFKQIPRFSRYEISKTGVIRKCIDKTIVNPTSSNSCKIANIKSDTSKWVASNVARLVLMTYKPLAREEMLFAKCVHIDGDSSNLNLSNLDWKFTMYKPPVVKPDEFVDIPGYKNYRIRVDGTLKSKTTGREKKGFLTHGYYTTDIYDGHNRPRRVGIHRLLALTFLPHPIDCDHLIINHIDGNPKNNELINLEWVGYSENITHAYKTGLRSDNTPIVVRTILDPNEQKFVSYGEAARFVGVTPQALHHWVSKYGPTRPYLGFLIKEVSDNRQWPTLEQINELPYFKAFLFWGKDLANGKVYKFRTLTVASKFTGFAPATLKLYTFGAKSGHRYRDWVFSRTGLF